MIKFSKGMYARMAILGMRQEAIEELLNGEPMRMYGGAVPDNVDEPLSALQKPLAVMYRGVATGFSGDAHYNGAATFFRWGEESGADPLYLQGTVGTQGAEIMMSSPVICMGQTISINAMTFRFQS